MSSSRTQRVASLRRTVAVCTLVVFMAAWGAVVKLGPGGGATSSASTPKSTGTGSLSTTSASQPSAPLTTSQS
jgi:hypothetical protein